MLTYNLQSFFNFFQIFLQSHSTMQCCLNEAFFKVREDHQESSALQQLHPAHLPSTAEKEAFKKVCYCYFNCCCLRKKHVNMHGFLPRISKDSFFTPKQNPSQVHHPKNQPQPTLLVSSSPPILGKH